MRSERFKHFFGWVASILLLAHLLSACSQDLLEQPSQLQGSFLIWHPFQGGLAKRVTLSFQDFQNINPSVNLISEYFPQSELSSYFIQQAKDGLGASAIIDFPRKIPELVNAQRIQSIDETAINASSYFPSTLTQVRYHNHIYGVPLGSQVRVLCYNQAKLAASRDKMLSQPPTSLAGLLQRAQKGYSVGMVSSFEDTFWGMGLFGVQFFDANGWVKPPQVEGWSKWLQWLKNASIQPNFVLLRDREILHKAFAQNKLTYYVCEANEIADLKEALKDDLRVARLPEEDKRQATPILYTRVMMLNASNNPNETKLALALAKFMTNPEQQLQGIALTQSFIPTNQNVRIDKDLLPIEAILLEQKKTAVAIPLDYLKQLILVFEQGELLYEQAITGNITSSAAARNLSMIINQQQR